jgi:hypothetical protein
MEINYCLFTLLHDNEARLSSIVAYLRKRTVVLSHCYNSANVIEPRESHTCNNTVHLHNIPKFFNRNNRYEKVNMLFLFLVVQVPVQAKALLPTVL